MPNYEIHKLVKINAGSASLEGMLEIPKDAAGIVLFAHGSGSSRLSSRNNYVAGILRGSGLGTLLFDLLTAEEAEDRRNVFDIDLLSNRLLAATAWVKSSHEASTLKIGYFGASTGAAAALKSSVETDTKIWAIVSRGGRPDMASGVLGRVKAPTLLIVGGDDDLVIELNREAYRMLECEKELKIVPGATHLFEEPGKMEVVATLANDWFVNHIVSSR